MDTRKNARALRPSSSLVFDAPQSKPTSGSESVTKVVGGAPANGSRKFLSKVSSEDDIVPDSEEERIRVSRKLTSVVKSFQDSEEEIIEVHTTDDEGLGPPMRRPAPPSKRPPSKILKALDNEETPRKPLATPRAPRARRIILTDSEDEDVPRFEPAHAHRPLHAMLHPTPDQDVIIISDSSDEDEEEKKAGPSRQPSAPRIQAPQFRPESSDSGGWTPDESILELNEPPGRKPIRTPARKPGPNAGKGKAKAKTIPTESSASDSTPLFVQASGDEGFTAIADPSPVSSDVPGSKPHPPRPTPIIKQSKSFSSNSTTDVQKTPRATRSQKAAAQAEQARREGYAQTLFHDLNVSVFESRIPETKLSWNIRLTSTAGRAKWHRSKATGVDNTEIELATKILDCDERIRNTLSHEMCHLACWLISNEPKEHHGIIFKKWGKKVMRKRPEIEVSTRHNYDITYKYEWKCQECSKIYGRHTKSIKPEEVRCGSCKTGKLAPLFTTRGEATPRPKSKTASRNAGPTRDSPRGLMPGRASSALSDSDDDEDDLAKLLGQLTLPDLEGC